MVSAWATGKTMCGILRGMLYSEMIPKNLGIIFRKEFVDLRDSTLIDFESYTGRKVNSQRNVDLSNGSRIMFRHLEEMNNIQNINLGWFFIEQAEELTSEDQFFTLWGRLRRAAQPSEAFIDLGLSPQTGFITANVKGNNWVRSYWKDNPKKGFHLTEAITFDNADVLKAEFIESLRELKDIKPDTYRRFVLNDWEVEVEGRAIPPELVEACVGGKCEDPIADHEYALGSDFAKRRDWWVIVVADKNTGQVVYFDRFQKESWALMRGKTVAVAKRYNDAEIVPDSTGIGDPITEDLERAGCRIYKENERPGYVFTPKSKERLIENLIVTMTNRKISYPRIPELIDELKVFEKSETPSGNVKYSAPAGKHDDCVIGLALACWGLPHIIDGVLVVYGTRETANVSVEEF